MRKTSPIDNSEDTIDSRDVIARIEWLEGFEGADLDEDEQAELKALKALAEDGETNVSDWADGATLISGDYFETYAKSFAEDIGAIKRDMDWPCNFIDWKAASEALRQDYSEIDFDGVTYWARS